MKFNSKEYKEHFRKLALEQNFGGDNTCQKYYSFEELHLLIKRYNELNCQETLCSLFSDKIYQSVAAWRNDVGRHIEKESRKNFYYLLEVNNNGKPTCICCQTELDIASFISPTQGFRKYCPTCIDNYVWARKEFNDFSARNQKISEVKLKFYNTEKGKKIAKEIGQKNSKSLKEFHKTAAGKKARQHSSIVNSQIMKDRILSGKFTPNSNNRNTHWDSSYKENKYRSSWEALYHYFDPDAEYEALRIPYNFNNKNHIYIVDFVNHKTKTAIEVKPLELTKDKKTQCKINALKEWCNCNNYTFVLADKQFLQHIPEPPNYSLFDEKTTIKIRKLYEQIKN